MPARAQITWATVGEDGGYRVAFADSTTTPVLPADDGARAAAQAWVDDEQACTAGASYDGNLLGQPSLADTLCRAGGTFTAGAPVGLDRFRDPSLVLNAFGADAPTFVRVVPVDRPHAVPARPGPPRRHLGGDRRDAGLIAPRRRRGETRTVAPRVGAAPEGPGTGPSGGASNQAHHRPERPARPAANQRRSMKRSRKLLRRGLPALGVMGALLAGTVSGAGASSHREAPLITEDPVADLTDVYAFVSPDDASKVTLIANVVPFESPAGGPNFYKFGDDVLYQLNVSNDGDPQAELQYQFRFTTTYANPATFLYNTGQVTSLNDKDLNVRQTYSVTEVNTATGKSTTLGKNLPVPPANVGPRSTPNYEANLGSAGVKSLGGGMKVFAGPRDDPFFVDLGSIFDLGGLRPFNPAHLIPLPAAPGKDYVAGYNVHSIAIQVPKSALTKGDEKTIGVWATTYRRAQRVLSSNKPGVLSHKGNWVQVARLGMPLVNEVVIPVGPEGQVQRLPAGERRPVRGQRPEARAGEPHPGAVPGGQGADQRRRRPGPGWPRGHRDHLPHRHPRREPAEGRGAVGDAPAEHVDDASGFPNGRLLTDDVTDTEIRALAGATAFTPAFNISPNKDLGDGVNANDQPFTGSFPYLAAPASGYGS